MKTGQIKGKAARTQFVDELMGILQRVWTKLQDLPQASSLEVGAFSVLILFAATVLFMFVLSCVHCCCCGNSKYQASRVQPLQP
uniref:Small integral membrane protein 5 n=1 Tax=Anabas testudineus TaxID=64144 RepID=A0AAQ6IA72_ANATE